MIGPSVTGSSDSDSLPVSIRATSSESLIRCSRCRPARDDLVEVVGVLADQFGQLEQLAEAEDRVERGTQLVAHPRQELALGLAGADGLLGGQFGAVPRGVGDERRLAAFGDVVEGAREAGDHAVLVEQGPPVDLQPPFATVGGHEPDLAHAVVVTAAGQRVGHVLGRRRPVVGVDVVQRVLADHLVGGDTGQLGPGPVHVRHAALAVDAHDDRADVVEDRFVASA